MTANATLQDTVSLGRRQLLTGLGLVGVAEVLTKFSAGGNTNEIIGSIGRCGLRLSDT